MATNKNHVLVIDDEPDIRQLLSITLSRMGLEPHCVENLKESHKALKEKKFRLCLTDLKLPDGSGIDLVEELQKKLPSLPVIVITAHGSMDIAIKAMKHGAFDFINKPVDLNHLRSLINNALSTNESKPDDSNIQEIIGQSTAALQLKAKIKKVSRSQAPVFIVGESGSGKELVARATHAHSSRKEQPFIAVNCGAIPRELMESEFFGHTKGSFTGAHQDKQGLFQAANGGTLFLDEIADLPLDMQVKLLRVIQEKKVRPIGSQTEIPIDIRLLSATHKDLSAAINAGEFRNDLYYRINVIEIATPPLRDRMDDLPILCDFILEKICKKNAIDKRNISKEAIKTLSSHHFPGNIRELENILERACALSEGVNITEECLQLTHSAPITARDQSSPQSKTNNIDNSLLEVASNKDSASNDSDYSTNYNAEKQSIDEYLKDIEKHILLQALEKNRWNRTATAKMLGITFRSLRYRLKKLGLNVDE